MSEYPDDGDDECGQEVGDAHVRKAEEVRADAEDQDVADGAEALEGGGRHDGLKEAGHQEDGPLEDADGERGEDAALAERRGHDHDDDGVEHGLGKQDGRVAEQAVVDGADDGHRADADRQGRGDEAVNEARVAAAACPTPQPDAEALHLILEIDGLAEQRAADEAREHAVRADEQDLPVSTDRQHLLDRPRQAEEHDGHGTGHHERLLEALRYQPPAAESQEAAADNPQHICQNTDSWKQESPALLNEQNKNEIKNRFIIAYDSNAS